MHTAIDFLAYRAWYEYEMVNVNVNVHVAAPCDGDIHKYTKRL